MKRYGLLLIALLFPVLLFANAWQAFRFQALARDVARLELRQHETIEHNKRLIAGLSVLRSPGRIREIAEEQLGLTRAGTGRVFTIQLEPRR